MWKTRSKGGICIILITMMAGFSAADAAVQNAGKTYTDSRGKKVYFPLGDASFADQVVSFEIGHPSASDPRWSDPKLALGPPNYISEPADDKKPAEVTLGCGGVLILHFTKTAIIDVPGPDVWVFEVGPSIEATHVDISEDGTEWISVGDAAGGTAGVDIAKVAQPDKRYHYVRVTDLKSDCGGRWPGADIDAVGAIGAMLHMTFDASVLFDFNRYALKPQAMDSLKAAAQQLSAYPLADITVEGHTDNVGQDAYNLKLSQDRANAVRSFLLSTKALAGRKIGAVGYGASRPIASNSTDEGRQRNRRVAILLKLQR